MIEMHVFVTIIGSSTSRNDLNCLYSGLVVLSDDLNFGTFMQNDVHILKLISY